MNLSLEVARIIHPEYEWRLFNGRRGAWPVDGSSALHFDHTTPEALGQMAVWLAKDLTKGGWCGDDAVELSHNLASDNPNKALAEAIVEAHNG